jgi:hypothetical protein
MDIWNIAEYAAWIISAGLALWMLTDMFAVGSRYDESLLLSSREGADELLDQGGLPGGDQ